MVEDYEQTNASDIVENHAQQSYHHNSVVSFQQAASSNSFTPRAAKASNDDGNANLEMRTPGVTQPSETSNRTLLKVYMANQLELNEADMESYEAVVNELAEQLTEVTKVKDELAVSIIQMHHEKDQAIRDKTEQWAEQKAELVSQISRLQESISETDRVTRTSLLQFFCHINQNDGIFSKTTLVSDKFMSQIIAVYS